MAQFFYCLNTVLFALNDAHRNNRHCVQPSF